MNKDEIFKRIASREVIRRSGTGKMIGIVGPWMIDPEKLAEFLASVLPLPDNNKER